METLFEPNSNNDGANTEKDYLSEMVGEGKKYKDANELAKAYAHLNAHTQVIQRENRDYRTQEQDLISKQKTLEENMQKIMEKLSSQTIQTNVTPQDGKPVSPAAVTQPPVQQSTLGPSDLKRLVSDVIKEEATQAQRKANLDAVNAKAIETYGSLEKANEVVQQKAAEMGLQLNDFAEVAMKSPKAFFELIGVKPQSNSVETKPSAVFNEQNSRSKPLDKALIEDDTKWEYYTHLRRTKPDLYYKPEIQTKIHRLVMEGKMALPR